MLHLYPPNELIYNLMPASGLKIVDTGATKGWKAKPFEKIQLGELLATNSVYWHQVCNIKGMC